MERRGSMEVSIGDRRRNMKPIRFKGCNSTYAKDQPEYLPLPVYKTDGMVVSCWKMGFMERIISLVTGKVYFALMTFNRPLQPQKASVRKKELIG